MRRKYLHMPASSIGIPASARYPHTWNKHAGKQEKPECLDLRLHGCHRDKKKKRQSRGRARGRETDGRNEWTASVFSSSSTYRYDFCLAFGFPVCHFLIDLFSDLTFDFSRVSRKKSQKALGPTSHAETSAPYGQHTQTHRAICTYTRKEREREAA